MTFFAFKKSLNSFIDCVDDEWINNLDNTDPNNSDNTIID